MILFALLFSCSSSKNQDSLTAPSDDPSDYSVDESVSYSLTVSEARQVVPGPGLPVEVTEKASNNNVEIHFHGSRLFMAWRSSPTHFAGTETDMWVVSSEDMGQTWDYETRISMETDVREPRFITVKGELQLLYFEAGNNPMAFEPIQMWRMFRTEAGDWTEAEAFGDPETVPWDLKFRNGKAWMSTYDGGHYEEGDVYVRFWVSDNGRDWETVEGSDHVHSGGVSETAFEFDAEGNLWVVGRNEDGDETGAGTNICYAPSHALSDWDCDEIADPERYDSPELVRHGNQFYLFARQDVGGPFGPDGDLLAYSARPKRTAIYRLNTETRKIEFLMNIPGVGDTAFPSVRRVSDHKFLLANYTSPLDNPDISWFEAQLSDGGTQLYLLDVEFMAE